MEQHHHCSKKEQFLVALDKRHSKGRLTLAAVIPSKSDECEDKSFPSSNCCHNEFSVVDDGVHITKSHLCMPTGNAELSKQ